MVPAWLEMNRHTLRLLDDVFDMVSEIRTFPARGGLDGTRAEGQMAQTLADLDLVVSQANLCRRTIELACASMPLDLPDVFYPAEFDVVAWDLLLAGHQLHDSMMVILTRYRLTYGPSDGES